MRLFPKNSYVFSSRNYLQSKLSKKLGISNVFELQELSYDEADEFISRYNSEATENKISFADFPSRLRHLGQTPLYLRFILELFDETSHLVKSPTGIVSGVMQKRLEWENLPCDTNIDHEIYQEKPSILIEFNALIAIAKLLENSGGAFQYYNSNPSTPSALRVITEIVGDHTKAELLIDEWCKKQILILNGEYVEFWHPVFQTYLLATDTANSIIKYFMQSINEEWTSKLQNIIEKTSDETVAMSIALIEPKIALDVVRFLKDKDTVLTGMCLNNMPDAKELRTQFINELYRIFLIIRIDWIGFPLFITLFILLIVSPTISMFFGPIIYLPKSLYEIVSLPFFIGLITFIGIIWEFCRILYAKWINHNFIKPIAITLGYMRFPDAINKLDQMIKKSNAIYFVQGIEHVLASIRLENVDSFDDLKKVLENKRTRVAAINEIAKRQNDERIPILLELLIKYTDKATLETVINLLPVIIDQGISQYGEEVRNTLINFYQLNRQVLTWATRIRLYRKLRKMHLTQIPYPWPNLRELLLPRISSGFEYLDLIKEALWIFIFAGIILGGILYFLSKIL